MRLIDAGKLEEKVREYFKEKIARGVYAVGTVNCSADICGMVEEQPTAFDVEQVVKQLESIKEKEYGVCSDEDCGYCKYFSRCQDGNMADMLTLDKAIEIVKRGGRGEEKE